MFSGLLKTMLNPGMIKQVLNEEFPTIFVQLKQSAIAGIYVPEGKELSIAFFGKEQEGKKPQIFTVVLEHTIGNLADNQKVAKVLPIGQVIEAIPDAELQKFIDQVKI